MLSDEILDIVSRETNVDRALLVPEARIDALGIASIDLMQAIFAIETRFDVEIPLAAADAGAEFATVGDLVAHAVKAIDRR